MISNLLKDPISPPQNSKIMTIQTTRQVVNIQKRKPHNPGKPRTTTGGKVGFSFQETDLLVVLIMVEPQSLDQKMGCLMSITYWDVLLVLSKYP